MIAWAIVSLATKSLPGQPSAKSTSDLFNEMIPLGRLIQMVNQKDRLLNDYLSPMDITATQFRVLCSIRCEVCITPLS